MRWLQMIRDQRIARIQRVSVVDGSLSVAAAGTFWQDESGKICGCSAWHDLLLPFPEDLDVQAKAKNISNLEWMIQRLRAIPYILVTV